MWEGEERGEGERRKREEEGKEDTIIALKASFSQGQIQLGLWGLPHVLLIIHF